MKSFTSSQGDENQNPNWEKLKTWKGNPMPTNKVFRVTPLKCLNKHALKKID
jgi:hypothetical protein